MLLSFDDHMLILLYGATFVRFLLYLRDYLSRYQKHGTSLSQEWLCRVTSVTHCCASKIHSITRAEECTVCVISLCIFIAGQDLRFSDAGF
jgi:hypothetical protein